MPRYFFDLSDRPDLPDMEGLELAGMDAVRIEAIRACGEILRDFGDRDWRALEWAMVIRDEAGITVLTLSFRSEEPEGKLLRVVQR